MHGCRAANKPARSALYQLDKSHIVRLLISLCPGRPASLCPACRITSVQRGNRRQKAFFGSDDCGRYRDSLVRCCAAEGIAIVAYCLMPNHVHLILVPPVADALSRALTPIHQTHAWIVNRRFGWTGHLWQQRFHSFAMDDAHLYEAVRYVEINPVRAGLSETAEAYAWSSAAQHCSGKSDDRVARQAPLDQIRDWRADLGEGLTIEAEALLRQHASTGFPLLQASALAHLELETGRRLTPRSRGRPGKATLSGMQAAS